MRHLPSNVTFDPIAFIHINRKSNKEILEFVLAEFEVFVPLPTIHAYLLGKEFLGKDIEGEFKEVEELYHIVFPSKDLLKKAVKIEARLAKADIFMSLEDIIVGVTAIVTNSLLVSADPKRFEPLRKYGLDCIGIEKFFEEIRSLAEEEAKKQQKETPSKPLESEVPIEDAL